MFRKFLKPMIYLISPFEWMIKHIIFDECLPEKISFDRKDEYNCVDKISNDNKSTTYGQFIWSNRILIFLSYSTEFSIIK